MTSRAELERQARELQWKREALLEVLVPMVVGAAMAALVVMLLS